MKKLIYLLLCILIIFPSVTNASHVAGGTISWDCLPSGEYVFKVQVYAECTGIPYSLTPSSLILTIVGNPLPRDNNNSVINTIQLYQDTLANIPSRRDMSLECGDTTLTIACSKGDNTLEKFELRSLPTRLNGTPPAQGWQFFFIGGGTGPLVQNMGISQPVFRAEMFVHPSNSNCNDNSPRFAERPPFQFCRSQLIRSIDPADDPDGDRLRYGTDIRLGRTGPVPFAPGYSASSPLPSIGLNTPFSLDSVSGEFQFQVNSNIGTNLYNVIKRVDSYRNNQLIASVYHDYPYYIKDCPSLPNQAQNVPPRINPPFYKGGITFSYEDSVVVGSAVNVNLSVRDTNTINNASQNIRIRLEGGSVAMDLRTANNCPSPSDTNCATMIFPPLYDAARDLYYYSAAGNWNGLMSWQTDCNDLGVNGAARTHYFYVIAQDDFCSVPGEARQMIAITVLPDTSICPPVITDLEEVEAPSLELQVFPNPTNGQISIEFGGSQRVNLQVFDFQGKLMKEEILMNSNEVIDMPESKGIYLLRLTNNRGEASYHKVVKN